MPSIRRGDLELHYEVQGQGPPIVLCHSFLCSGEMWAPQVGPLRGKHRVINIDARGHGRSGPVKAKCTLRDMVEDVLAVLDQEGVERAVWAGLSVGGMIALRAALATPERVAALVLLDTDAGVETARQRVENGVMVAIARLLGVRPLLPSILRRMFGETTLREQPGLVAEWRARIAQADVASSLRVLRAIRRRTDLTGRLAEINVPTLVIVGLEDRSLPPSRSQTIARGIPGAELVEIPGAGHLSTLEQPAAVTETMLRFLRDL